MLKFKSSLSKEEHILKIFEIGIAILKGSVMFDFNEKDRETSKSVALKFNLSPSEEKRTHERIGRVDLFGTTLFKFFKASIKSALLILKFISQKYKQKILYKNKKILLIIFIIDVKNVESLLKKLLKDLFFLS